MSVKIEKKVLTKNALCHIISFVSWVTQKNECLRGVAQLG